MNQSPGISFKAIVIGALTDVGGSMVTGIVAAAILGISLARQGVPESDVEARLIESAQSPAVLIGILVVGLGFSFLGGFIAGRIAKSGQVIHAGMAGAVAVFLGLLLLGRPDITDEVSAGIVESLPVWFDALSYLLVVPTAMLGGYVAKQQ
ncbi:MAG: hypothetical protein ACE5MG_13250 [Candidatus Methylomirabilales bacterium]